MAHRRVSAGSTPSALRCRRKFLRYFPEGFHDQKYLDWERDYKWHAHLAWRDTLGKSKLRALLRDRQHEAVAAAAVRIESRTNLLFSFEKMALRDAVKSRDGARAFADGVCDFLYGPGSDADRFERWRDVIGSLPRRQTRVLTWPVLTAHLPEAERDARRRQSLRRAVGLHVAAGVGHLRVPAGVRRARAARSARPSAQGSDRCAEFHLGARVRRVLSLLRYDWAFGQLGRRSVCIRCVTLLASSS
jgi:integrase